MRSIKYFVLISFCTIISINNIFAQAKEILFIKLRDQKQNLDQIYQDIQNNNKLPEINENQEIDKLKHELFLLKKELRKSNIYQKDITYQINFQDLDHNFELLDFYIYDWTIDSYRIIARLRCKTKLYSDFVKLEYSFYNNNSLIGEDYTYIDYESYGYSGMLPYKISFLETFTDKVDFDSIAFKISYWIEDGTGDILWDQIMELKSNQIIPGTYLQQWTGMVKNKTNYSVTFPKIFACIFKDDRMIDLDYTYIDVKNKDPKTIRIYFVTTKPTEDEQITLKNYADNSVDISNWTLGDINNPTAYTIPQGMVLAPEEYIKFTHTQLGFQIDDEGEIIYLKNTNGITIDTWDEESEYKFYPNTSCYYDSYIDLPGDYDKIKYYLCYSLYSLEGSGNITSNWPTFTQLRYSGQERTPIQFDVFLIDHDNDQIEVQIDWGDYSNLIWQGPFFSRSVPSLNHGYSQPGKYYISAKSKDGLNSETNWSDSLKVEILPIDELKITTQQLKAGTYKKLYRDTLKAEGGITPYQWALSSGNLPNGLNLNSNNGEIFGIPSASDTYSFCIMVTDGGNPSVSDTAAFQIIINNNPPQLISASSININEHEELNYTARAIDPDGNALSYNFENYPMWLIPKDSTIYGIVPEGAKDTCFTIIASDGELMDTLIVNVTVTPVNDPPKIISPDSVSAIEDSVFQYTAKATDPEGDKINYFFDGCPKWLTPSDSTISGIPLEGTQDTSFMVIASDGKLNDTLKVFVNIIRTQ